MKVTYPLLLAGIALGLAGAPPVVRADDGAGVSATASSPWTLEWDARYRHEQVNDDAFAKDARADTLRLRLGLRGDLGSGWGAYVEGAGVAAAGNHYNSGANGKLQYPGITDPRGGELNQAYVSWKNQAFTAIVGRQVLAFDNQRWIGPSAWRQFEQTFDAVSLAWKPASHITVRYAWLDRVHRVAGPDALNRLARERRLDTHLFNVGVDAGAQQLAGYAYLHEDKDVPAASTATWGVRWSGKALVGNQGLVWAAEIARQRDYRNNPQHYAHNYWLLEPGYTVAGFNAKLGWEHLGGDGKTAVQTPLASLHPFNGWADQFNVTPANGLNDRYVALDGLLGVGKFKWALAWHNYHAVHGNAHYGSEWNALIGYPMRPGLAVQAIAARYRADRFAHDDTKLFVQLEWTGKQAL